MDFDKTAELIARMHSMSQSENRCFYAIAAALRAAYNEGLEDGKEAGRVDTLSLLSQAARKPT